MTAHPSLAMPHRMDGFPILHTDDTDAFAPSRIDAFRCMRTVLYVSFRLLFGLLLALDFIFISSYLHEGLYRFLALSPRLRTERKRDCHGDDDLGRHIALDFFSELGYTAFALLPDRPAATSAPDASNVSLLIQEWHKKKRSGHSASSCGLVAPIVLDMNSSPQRTRAFETVDAYCAAHSLHLVAIIMQPATEFMTSKPQFQPGRAGLNPSAWGDVVRQCLVVPLSVVQDYVGLLAAASGRVILLSASGDQTWTPSLHRGVLLSTAHFLGHEFRSFGIRVSTVLIGPFIAALQTPQPMHTKASPMKILEERGVYIQSLRNTIDDVLRHFLVRHEDVRHTLQDIVRSRYPRERVLVGLHAMLQAAFELAPSTQLCLQSITPYLA